jgi:uncharacterized protein YndB with AHSA1/START domain
VGAPDWQECSNVTYFPMSNLCAWKVLMCEPLRRLSFTWGVPGDETARERLTRVTFEDSTNGFDCRAGAEA